MGRELYRRSTGTVTVSRRGPPRSSVLPPETSAAGVADEPAPKEDGATDSGVEGNARLTGMTAVVLFVLLTAEGFTILRIGRLLTLHVVVGMVLVPPTLLENRKYDVAVCPVLPRFSRVHTQGPSTCAAQVVGPVRRRADNSGHRKRDRVAARTRQHAERVLVASQGDVCRMALRHVLARPGTHRRHGAPGTEGLLPADAPPGPRGRQTAMGARGSTVRRAVAGGCGGTEGGPMAGGQELRETPRSRVICRRTVTERHRLP